MSVRIVISFFILEKSPESCNLTSITRYVVLDLYHDTYMDELHNIWYV